MSISPKHHSSSKPNYPLECKPNINDLRQLFDENSRAENKKNHRHSAIYADAKHTSLDESIFDYKGGYHQSQSIVMAAIPNSRNPDFERVKQKFDKPNVTNSPSSSSNTRNGKKARNFSSFLKFNNKRTDSIPSTNCDVASKMPNNSNLTESIDSVDSTKAVAGDSLSNKKIDAYMHSSINIDGLKVSDDDEVSIWCSHQRLSSMPSIDLSLFVCSNCFAQFAFYKHLPRIPFCLYLCFFYSLSLSISVL